MCLQSCKSSRILQVGYIRNKGESGLLICVFSQPVPQQEVPHVVVDAAEASENLVWYAPNSDKYSYVWVSAFSFSYFFSTPVPHARGPIICYSVSLPSLV